MILGSFIAKQTNYRVPGTIAWKARHRRMSDFNGWIEQMMLQDPNRLIAPTHHMIKIIDIGGVPEYWHYLNYKYIDNSKITSVNTNEMNVPEELRNNVISVVGNATDLQEFENKSFDLAFSNSVIEHVGTISEQKAMAKEMIRVASHGYLQTPNKYFFMEPHFLVPFFQFLPRRIKAELAYRLKFGIFQSVGTRTDAIELVDSVNLLSYRQLQKLFPEAKIIKEKWLGMTKSFILRW